jgi:hypothetical protein
MGDKARKGDAVNADALTTLLSSYRFVVASEQELQRSVAQALRVERVAFAEEVSLGAGERIDFLCEGGIGLELKIKGSPSEVLLQLQRYAASEAVTELVLVTTRIQHHAMLGSQRTVGGKPLRVVRVAGGFL